MGGAPAQNGKQFSLTNRKYLYFICMFENLGAWPWMALLGYGNPEEDRASFRCGSLL